MVISGRLLASTIAADMCVASVGGFLRTMSGVMGPGILASLTDEFRWKKLKVR